MKRRTSYSSVYEIFEGKDKNFILSNNYNYINLISRTQRFRLCIAQVCSYLLIGSISLVQQWIKIWFYGNRHRSFDAIRSRQFMINHDEERISVIIRQGKILTWFIKSRKRRFHIFEIYAEWSESIEHGIQIDVWLVWRLPASSFRLRY